MVRISLSALAVSATMFGTAGFSQSTNDGLFDLCAGYFSASRDYARSWDYFSEVQNPQIKQQYNSLRSTYRAELAEAKRLQQIAEVMQSSDEVWDKYNRAFDRYERAKYEFDSFTDQANNIVNAANAAQGEREVVNRRIDTECPTSWSTDFARNKCNSGRDSYQAICFALGM